MTKIKQVDLKNTPEQTHKHWGAVSSMNIMMSQYGNLFALLAFFAGNPPVANGFTFLWDQNWGDVMVLCF